MRAGDSIMEGKGPAMVALKTKMSAINDACEASGVKRLDLFGSCARGENGFESDVDFLVEFVDPLQAGLLDRYLALHGALQSILGCQVDLVECSAIENRALQKRIEEDKRLVYAA